jgi:hypothetical protein
MRTVAILFFVVLTGSLAARKNRSALAWGLFGLIPLIALLVLAFMPYLCPKCKHSITNKEWKNRTCPHCGDISKATMHAISTSSSSSSSRDVVALTFVASGWALITWVGLLELSGFLVRSMNLEDTVREHFYSEEPIPLLIIVGFVSALLTKIGVLPGTKIK